jgi:hypothetical protein
MRWLWPHDIGSVHKQASVPSLNRFSLQRRGFQSDGSRAA